MLKQYLLRQLLESFIMFYFDRLFQANVKDNIDKRPLTVLTSVEFVKEPHGFVQDGLKSLISLYL